MCDLIGDRRGAAAIEFAFISLFLFGTLMVALDFGFYVQQRLKLGNAVEQAAILAFNQQMGTSANSGTSSLNTYVQTYSGLKRAPTATITCNGTSTCGDGKCSCINSSGGFTIAAACNAVCAGSNAISGNYMKITATAPYSAVIVPNRYLGGGTITQSAVVRLQ